MNRRHGIGSGHRADLRLADGRDGGFDAARELRGAALAAYLRLTTPTVIPYGCWGCGSLDGLGIRGSAPYSRPRAAGAAHPSKQNRPGEKRGYP